MTTPRDLGRRLATRDESGGRISRHQGVVQALDGTNDTVSITLDGGSVVVPNVRYLNSYSPAVDDTVEVIVDDTDLFVVGKLGASAGGGGGDHADSDHTFQYDPPSPTTPHGDYPLGVSQGTVLSSDGWPVTGTLVTINRSSIRCVQYLTQYDNLVEYRRTHHSSIPDWSTWQLIEGPSLTRALQRQNAYPSGGGTLSWDGSTLAGTRRYIWIPSGAGSGSHFVLTDAGSGTGAFTVSGIGNWNIVHLRPSDAQWAATSRIDFTPADLFITAYNSYSPHENDLVLGVMNGEDSKFYLRDGRVLTP